MRWIGLTICLLATSVVGCSNHWREAPDKFTVQDVERVIGEIEQSQAQSLVGGNLTEALQLKDDPNASVYYAEAPSDLGQIPNVLGFFNYEFLGMPSDFGYKNISKARVLFFDAPQPEGGRKSALIIGIATGDSFQYFAFTGSASIEDDLYQADLNGADGNVALYVQSSDVDGGLDSVIQLKVFGANGGYLGKIATLIGFKY